MLHLIRNEPEFVVIQDTWHGFGGPAVLFNALSFGTCTASVHYCRHDHCSDFTWVPEDERSGMDLVGTTLEVDLKAY